MLLNNFYRVKQILFFRALQVGPEARAAIHTVFATASTAKDADEPSAAVLDNFYQSHKDMVEIKMNLKDAEAATAAAEAQRKELDRLGKDAQEKEERRRQAMKGFGAKNLLDWQSNIAAQPSAQPIFYLQNSVAETQRGQREMQAELAQLKLQLQQINTQAVVATSCIRGLLEFALPSMKDANQRTALAQSLGQLNMVAEQQKVMAAQQREEAMAANFARQMQVGQQQQNMVMQQQQQQQLMYQHMVQQQQHMAPAGIDELEDYTEEQYALMQGGLR